jgi:hypothetical protein
MNAFSQRDLLHAGTTVANLVELATVEGHRLQIEIT